jgi:hypothetical protein
MSRSQLSARLCAVGNKWNLSRKGPGTGWASDHDAADYTTVWVEDLAIVGWVTGKTCLVCLRVTHFVLAL